MKKASTIMRVLLVLLAFLTFLPACEKKKEAPPQRPLNVGAQAAERKDAPLIVSGVGHVLAMRTVTLQPQVTGFLQAAPFVEGGLVREGQPLFTIDPAPFQAQLTQARATLARDWAKAEQSGRDYVRYLDLVRKDVVSQDDYEQRRTQSESDWSQVRVDQGALETARINLAYCSIVSPVTGVAGYQLVKPGNPVSAYTTTLVTINQVQPILVRFSVSEGDLALVRQYFGSGPLQASAREPKGEHDVKGRGVLTAIDNAVDPQTGMISLQAQFDNADLALWPGEFVNTAVTVAVEKNQLMIPEDAVLRRQDGAFVFVVTPANTAELRPVKLGRTIRGKETVVLEGLKDGEKIVTDGLIRVAPGAPLNIVTAGAGTGTGAASATETGAAK